MNAPASTDIRPVPPRQLAWLRSEVVEWASQGIISEDQADRITTRYTADTSSRFSVGRVLLALGGGFVGIGLIWLVAANLEQLSPAARFVVVALIWLAFLTSGEILAARKASAPLVGSVRLLAALGIGAVLFQAAQSLQVPAFEPRLLGLWSVAALLHGYLARAPMPFVVGVLSGVGWWFSQPLWDEQSALTVVVLLGAGAVLAAGLAVLHDNRLDAFAWTWRTVGGAMALLALFVAAIPDIGEDAIVWSVWVVVALVAAGAAAAAALATRPGERSLEPLGAIVVLVVATLIGRWTTGADASDVDAADWLHAAVSVTAYVLLAIAIVALGTVREHPPLRWMAMGGLVVFTTFQSFAVFAPIVTGAWLFVVLGTVFLGTGFLFDRARRGLAQALDTDAPSSPPAPPSSPLRLDRRIRPMNRIAVTALIAVGQLAMVGLAVAPQLSARVAGDTYLMSVAPIDPIDPFRGAYVALDYPDLRHDTSASLEEPGLGALDDGEVGAVYVTLVQQGDVWAADEWTRDRPEDGPYLACDDRSWQVRCGIESYFLPQDEAAETEDLLRDGAVAEVRIDGRGNAALVDVRAP